MTASQADVHQLDQAVLDAGQTLTRLRLNPDATTEQIDAARAALLDAMNARWPDA